MVLDDIIDDEIKRMYGSDETKNRIAAIFKLPISSIKKSPAVCADEKATLEEVINLMQKNKLGSIVITDKDGAVAGIITERDLLTKVLNKVENYKGAIASEYMTKKPLTLRNTDKVAHVMHNMHIGGYRHIPIVDVVDGKKIPVGVVSIRNINSFIVSFFPEEIFNIASVPYRGTSEKESA